MTRVERALAALESAQGMERMSLGELYLVGETRRMLEKGDALPPSREAVLVEIVAGYDLPFTYNEEDPVDDFTRFMRDR